MTLTYEQLNELCGEDPKYHMENCGLPIYRPDDSYYVCHASVGPYHSPGMYRAAVRTHHAWAHHPDSGLAEDLPAPPEPKTRARRYKVR